MQPTSRQDVQPRSLSAEFFLLRTPVLPLETLARWAEGTRATSALACDDEALERALAADRALLRTRLSRLAADPQVAQALELASPDLADALATRRRGAGTRRAHSAERALARYITRLASRPALFGLGGAYSVGRFTSRTRLQIGARSRLELRARLDSGLLREVVRRAAGDAGDDPQLVVRRNPGVYRVGGRLRVAARKPGSTAHRLVEVRPTTAVDLALETAAAGATIGCVTHALTEIGTPADHAAELVRRLLRSELLVPVADVAVTGLDPTTQAAEALASIPGADASAGAVARAARAVVASAVVGRAAVEAVSRALAPTHVEINPRRCLQVDARRPGELELAPNALAELRRSIELLVRVAVPVPSPLESFRTEFTRRFGSRSVPLLEALDPDFGIRLTTHAGTGDGVPAPSLASARRRVLLRLMERRTAPEGVVELTADELDALDSAGAVQLPPNFALLTSLVGRGGGAPRFWLVEPALVGVGARLLGRLCRGDAELTELVREHHAREASLRPDVVLAELSIAPETDAGLNVTQRPLLRAYEIEYGGTSGAPAERRLSPSDLSVSVEEDEVVLRSASLGRPVVPYASTAMNPLWISLPAGRFLLSLAHQRTSGDLGWSWGDLADAPELPRVVHGQTILVLRRWNVTAAELADVRPGTDTAGFRRLQTWRHERRIPRLAALEHPKSRIVVDFGNVLSVEAFLASARRLDMIRLTEAPAAEESPVTGPDGRYAHELIVPFILDRRDGSPSPAHPRRPARSVSERRRRHAPGGEWLYANLFGPLSVADHVLVDHVAPLTSRLRQDGLVDRWFFVRYADPDPQLRVRYHGEPRALSREVLPVLHEALAPVLEEGALFRISLDTYEREIERYGGVEGVEVMELVAEADSDAVVSILHEQVGPLQRRHCAAAAVAALYAGAELPVEERHACSVTLRTSWLPPGAHVGSVLGPDERAERAQLAELFSALRDGCDTPALNALRDRSEALVPVLEALRALEERGILERSLQDVLTSLAHMTVNRMLRRGGNLDEAKVHHALARIYERELARDRPPARV